jgi:hypothetical protein
VKIKGGFIEEYVNSIWRSKQIKKINNGYIKCLKKLRNETRKYRDISDKHLQLFSKKV